MQTLILELMVRNALQPDHIVSATFTATADLDALFPAAAARQLQGWDGVALLDMQQLAVRGDLPRCIRVLLLAWLPARRPAGRTLSPRMAAAPASGRGGSQ